MTEIVKKECVTCPLAAVLELAINLNKEIKNQDVKRRARELLDTSNQKN